MGLPIRLEIFGAMGSVFCGCQESVLGDAASAWIVAAEIIEIKAADHT
jgi:hypothetical protein